MAQKGPPVTDRAAMQRAIAAALQGIRKGQAPFGCCIVKGGRVIACGHNTVWQDGDPSAHAEVNAIRKACRRLGTIDLSGCVMFCTCEPCPMCYSAGHWARVSKIVFGARIVDARRAGFNELAITVERMKKAAHGSVVVVPEFMAEECRRLFAEWRRQGLGRAY